jgi:hypothetical protein
MALQHFLNVLVQIATKVGKLKSKLLCIITAIVLTTEDIGLCLEIARLPSLTVSEQSCCCGHLVPQWEQNAFQK